jgi:hypothetical protein
MPTLLTPNTQSQYQVFCGGIDLLFTTFSGIQDTAETSNYPSGTGNRILPLVGPRTLGEITLTSPHDPKTSQGIEQLWQEYNNEPLTVTVQPVTCDGNENVGQPYIFDGCLLSGVEMLEVDRSSAEASMLSLVFQPSTWRRG